MSATLEAPPEPLLFTEAQAAQRLGVRPALLRRLRQRGDIKSRALGGTPGHPNGIRYTADDIRAVFEFIANNDHGAAVERPGVRDAA